MQHGTGGGAPALRVGGGVGDAQQVAGDVADAGEPAVLEPFFGSERGAALGVPGVGASDRSGLQLRDDVVGLLVSDADGGQGLKHGEPRRGGLVLVGWGSLKTASPALRLVSLAVRTA